MALSQPRVEELFGDASPKKLAQRKDEFDGAIAKSLANATHDPSVMMQVNSGSVDFNKSSNDPLTALQSLATNKSMAPDALAALNSALAIQSQASQDIVKDISLTTPLSTSFAAYDLEAPAKLLTPRPTPLRNKIVRIKGVGTAHRVKRITGYTGTGTGGQGNIWPGITESTTTTFGSQALIRGPKIAYSADDLTIPYNTYGLSDQVSWDAQFSGMGYQDLRQLSSQSTLYATMLMEERMMLMARGTASGYSGALSAPGTPTLTAVSATGSVKALTNATYYVYVTSDAGISGSGFGESVVTTVQSQATSSQALTITIPAAVTGALGYNIYAGTSTGVANATYQGRTTSLTFTLGGAGTSNTGNQAAYTTSGPAASRASSDTSAYATGYDGILATVLGANTGYNNNIASTFSTSNPGVEFQTVFANLYNTVKADPDEILLNGADRRQLSDAIKNASGSNYRINLQQSDVGGYTGGAVVDTLVNEITGKQVALTVHPWLPQGVAPVLSYTLPIPDSQVSNVWANVMVQDYMGVNWPVNQQTYDFSTYFRGAFFCYAPAWNGVVSGITAA